MNKTFQWNGEKFYFSALEAETTRKFIPEATKTAKALVKALADNKTDEAFNKAVAEASKQSITSQDDFITLFVKAYKKQAPNGQLAELFATQQLKDKVTTRSSDSEV